MSLDGSNTHGDVAGFEIVGDVMGNRTIRQTQRFQIFVFVSDLFGASLCRHTASRGGAAIFAGLLVTVCVVEKLFAQLHLLGVPPQQKTRQHRVARRRIGRFVEFVHSSQRGHHFQECRRVVGHFLARRCFRFPFDSLRTRFPQFAQERVPRLAFFIHGAPPATVSVSRL